MQRCLARVQERGQLRVVTEPAAGQQRGDRRPKPAKAGGSSSGSGRCHSSRGPITATMVAARGLPPPYRWRYRLSGRTARDPAVPRRRAASSHSYQATSSWLALKIDEYVPLTTPMRSASVNVLMVDRAEQQEALSVTTTVRLVLIERPSRLQDRVVDDRPERLPGVPDAVLADAVEHHDRVMDAEADDRQQRGHEQGIEFQAEEVAQDREASPPPRPRRAAARRCRLPKRNPKRMAR